MTTLTQHSFYNVTCKVCAVIRDVLVKGFIGVVNFFEAIGRAQAAARLMDMGQVEAAKYLMLEGNKKDG